MPSGYYKFNAHIGPCIYGDGLFCGARAARTKTRPARRGEKEMVCEFNMY
jgi:hypothetical protein